MDIKKNGNNGDSLDQLLDQELKISGAGISKNGIDGKQDTNVISKGKATGAESDKSLKPLSVGEWMLIILPMLIPVVNIIFMAMWAFSSEGNIHRRNFARAAMLWLIILLIACIVILVIAGNSIMSLFR